MPFLEALDMSKLQQMGAAAATVGSVLLGWFLKTRKRRLVSGYLTRIESTYEEYRTNPQECRKRLNQMKKEVDDMLKKGKLDETQLSILDTRIARYLRDLT